MLTQAMSGLITDEQRILSEGSKLRPIGLGLCQARHSLGDI